MTLHVLFARALHERQPAGHRERYPAIGGRDTCDLDADDLVNRIAADPETVEAVARALHAATPSPHAEHDPGECHTCDVRREVLRDEVAAALVAELFGGEP